MKLKRETKLLYGLAAIAVVIAGLVWWGYSAKNASVPKATPAPSGSALASSAPVDYYDNFRAQREQTRQQEAKYYDDLAADESADATVRRDAQRAKMDLAENMEHELVIEQLLLAKGYEDAAVTVSQGGVNVVVKTQELTAVQSAVILEAVTRQTGLAASEVFIVTSP